MIWLTILESGELQQHGGCRTDGQMFESSLTARRVQGQHGLPETLSQRGKGDGVLRIAKRKKEKRKENICIKGENQIPPNLKLNLLDRCLF